MADRPPNGPECANYSPFREVLNEGLVDTAFDAQGSVVAVGKANYRILIQRYDARGDLDSTFGTGGTVVIDGQPDKEFHIRRVAIQSDGRIVVAGDVEFDIVRDGPNSWTSTHGIVLVRVQDDGQLDPTFSGGGLLIESGLYNLTDMKVDLEDRIVLVNERGIVRMAADGSSRDPTFGENGIIPAAEAPGSRLALHDDGRILVLGSRTGGIRVTRLDANGVLDSTFGTAGVADIDGHFGDSFFAVQPTGRRAFSPWMRTDGFRWIAARKASTRSFWSPSRLRVGFPDIQSDMFWLRRKTTHTIRAASLSRMAVH